MKHKIHLPAAIAICLALVSCMKEKLETTYNNQEDKIDQYIEKNRGESRVVYNAGSTRLVIKSCFCENPIDFAINTCNYIIITLDFSTAKRYNKCNFANTCNLQHND